MESTPKRPRSRSYEGYTVSPDGSGEVIPLRGELHIDEPVRRGRKNAKKERDHVTFTLTDSKSMSMLELTLVEGKIFWAFVDAINPDTHLSQIRVAQIAENLGMTAPSVHRTLNLLLERKILFKVSMSEWRINPWIAYRGNVQAWEDATDDEPMPIWTRS
jgi:hypothetical protein